jgi:hypothetical protein
MDHYSYLRQEKVKEGEDEIIEINTFVPLSTLI